MVPVKGKLLSYKLNPKSKRLNPYDMHHSHHDLEFISKNPQVIYCYELKGKSYRGTSLSLLGAVKTNILNSYLGQKPKTVTVYINPNNPNESTLNLGQFSRSQILRVGMIAAVTLIIVNKYVG